MRGRTCAGTLVTGLDTGGCPRETYLYHIVDNEQTMREWGAQAVVWQTAIQPVVALELLATGTWAGVGVLGPEAFRAHPSSTCLPNTARRQASTSALPPLRRHPRLKRTPDSSDQVSRAPMIERPNRPVGRAAESAASGCQFGRRPRNTGCW